MSDFFNEWFYGGDDDDDGLEADDGGDWIGDGGDDGEPPWFGNEITLYDLSREPVSYTYLEWRELALQPGWFLRQFYDMDNMHILLQLDDMELMSAADWAEWRADYSALND